MATNAVQERSGVLREVQVPIERLQIRNILCPVDFSDFSRSALRYAISLARHFGSGLVVQHTAQPAYLPMEGLPMEGFAPSFGAITLKTQLQIARDEIRRMLIATGIDTSEVTVLLSDGDVTSHIMETISKERIDLIVMGTHGHKGFNRAVMGSVAEYMIHHAVCPVLVASRPPEDIADPDQGAGLRTILLATDFSIHSDRALVYALKWGCEWGSKVVLFHAVEEAAPAMKGLVELFPEYNPYFEERVAAAWKKIGGMVSEAARSWCEVVYEIRHGNPKEDILRVAEEKGADLIITGARGAGRSGARWGSVSSAVVRDGRFPVLVVRELSA
jgi:nucleotide-binding universal stress UspA family protein